jgi:hypothetical protein
MKTRDWKSLHSGSRAAIIAGGAPWLATVAVDSIPARAREELDAIRNGSLSVTGHPFDVKAGLASLTTVGGKTTVYPDGTTVIEQDDPDDDDDDDPDDKDDDDATEAMIRASCAVVPYARRAEHEKTLRAKLAALPKSAPRAAAPVARTRDYDHAPPVGVSYGTPMGGKSAATDRAALIASAPKAYRKTLETMPTSMLAKTIEGLNRRSA